MISPGPAISPGPGIRRRFTATGRHGPLRGIHYPNGTVIFRWEAQAPAALSLGAPDIDTMIRVHHVGAETIAYQDPAEPIAYADRL